jgi:hypothetical protein
MHLHGIVTGTIFFRRAGTRAPVRRAGPGTAVSSGWRQSARTGSTMTKVGSSEPEFLNVQRARNRFQGIDSASLCSPAGKYDK